MIADMSLHHLAYIIASCTFTIEPTRADYGYDLSVFTFDPSGQYENGNVFVQLKATDKIKFDKKTGDVKFRISKRDILTWESEPFPVYLVVFDAIRRNAYCIYLQKALANANISSSSMAKASVEVFLPKRDINTMTIQDWRIDKNAVLTQMNAVTHV